MKNLSDENSSDGKSKPRSQNYFLKHKIFNTYSKEMEVETKEFSLSENIDFHLFKRDENIKNYELNVLKIAYFYDRNFIGNSDFIHIPNIYDVAENTLKYPILLATDSFGSICGITTIKYENNRKITDNPYFPTVHEHVLNITGILTRLNNKVPHVGRSLYETAIRGAYELNKSNSFRLICYIDSRNVNSINSIANAVRDLKQKGLDVDIILTGFYEIYKKARLQEAPTFVFEIKFHKNYKELKNKVVFSYEDCLNGDILNNISNKIFQKTDIKRNYINFKKSKTIIYHSIRPINALSITVLPGKTADGNNRVPTLPGIVHEIPIEQEIYKELGDFNIYG